MKKRSQAFVFETDVREGRQALVWNIDMAIAMQGPRIRGGIYQVSIRRIGKGEPQCQNCGMHHSERVPCPEET